MRFVSKDLNNPLVRTTQLLLTHSKDYNSNSRVRDNIRIIYCGCCAYCECKPEAGAFYHIEHFYPKNLPQYKQYRKSIENLHYSCPICNTLKGQQEPLYLISPNWYLDSTGIWMDCQENMVEDEICYVGYLLFSNNPRKESIDRGEKTIECFNLNNQNKSGYKRAYLIEKRIRSLADVIDIIRILLLLLSNYKKCNNKQINDLLICLVEYTEPTSPYSTMIIHNFGMEILKLIEIYLKIRK